jgi:N-methylhydantoinase A
MTYRLGVDVGGTFTDFLLLDEESGETFTAKVPSTPEDSSIGVLNGVARICEESGVDPPDQAGHARHDGGHQRGADRPRRPGRAW